MNDLITAQKYLDGELSAIEKKEFEIILQNDQDLREDLLIIGELDDLFYDTDLLEFENNVRKLIKEENHNKKSLKNKTGISFLKKYYIAASIPLILGFILYLFIIISKPNTHRLYDKYYEKHDPDVIKRSDTSSENLFAFALEEYVNRNYLKAIDIFEEIILNNKNKILATFYSGMCYMELKEYEKAINYFDLTYNSDSLIQIHSEWYTALALLKLNKLKRSKELFEKIASENGYYSEIAGKILSDLK